MFGQVFEWSDVALIALLVVLEGVMSIDNALVLGMLARRLPKAQQPRALTYGLVGAFVFRLIAIATAQYLFKWSWVKLVGGGYLAWVAIKYFVFEAKSEAHEEFTETPEGEIVLVGEDGKPLSPEEAELELKARAQSPVPELDEPGPNGNGGGTGKPSGTPGRKYPNFWLTVGSIELTDIAFAVDSILAAIALVGANPNPEGAHPKLWVVFSGGFIGVVLMRFAATIFIKLLEKFPRFEVAAYLLVLVIGVKLLVDYFANSHEPGVAPVVDFHSSSHPAFWIFWGAMLLSFCVGFIPQKHNAETPPAT